MRSKFPWTSKVDLNLIDSTAKGDASRKLEFYPSDERDNPLPGKPTVEVFGKDVTESDLMGEVLSHHLPKTDKQVARFRQQILDSMTPQQKQSIRGDYQNERKAGLTKDSFETWLSKQGGDSFFRGYPTGQWPSSEYTAQQKQVYAQLQSYLDGSSGPSEPQGQRQAPVSLAPVIQGRMEQIEREKRLRETQQKVAQARQVMQRRQSLMLPAGQKNQGAAYQPTFGLGQPYREVPKIDLSVQNTADMIRQAALGTPTSPTFEQDRATRVANKPLSGIGDLRRYEEQQAKEEARVKSGIRSQVLKEESEREANAASGSEAQLLAQRARKEGLNPPDIEGQVDERYQSYLRSIAPEMIAQRKVFGELSPAARSVAAPVARSIGGLMKTAGGLTGLGGLRPTDFSRWANERGRFVEESANLAPLNQKGEEIVRGLPEKAVSAVTDLGLSISQIILLKKATGLPLSTLMALETTLKTSDTPTTERARQIAKSYAMGAVLDQSLSRPMSALVFGAEPGLENLAEYQQGRMTAEDALLQTGIQVGTGFILGGKGPKNLPKEAVDYTLKSPYTPEPVKDVVANVVQYGKGLIRSEDGRAMSLYSDPKTGEVFGSEITPEQADKYDPTIVTGNKRPVRNAKEINAEDYDFLARTLGVETKTPLKGLPESSSTTPSAEPKEVKPVSRPVEPVSSSLDQKPEARAEKPKVSEVEAAKPQQIAPDQFLQERTAKTQNIIPPNIPTQTSDLSPYVVSVGNRFKVIKPTRSGISEYGLFRTENEAQQWINKALGQTETPTTEPAVTPPAEVKAQPSATESQITTPKEVTDEVGAEERKGMPAPIAEKPVSTETPKQAIAPQASEERTPKAPTKPPEAPTKPPEAPSKPTNAAQKLTEWGSRLKTIAQSKNLDDLQALSDEMAAHKDDPRVARLRQSIQEHIESVQPESTEAGNKITAEKGDEPLFAKSQYSPAIQQAFKDWNEGKAYLGGGGNYRVRAEAATPTHRPSGKVASWNKEVKRAFPSSAEFHAAAKESIGQDISGKPIKKAEAAEPESGQSSMFADDERAPEQQIRLDQPEFSTKGNHVSLNNAARLLMSDAYRFTSSKDQIPPQGIAGVFEENPEKLARGLELLAEREPDRADGARQLAQEVREVGRAHGAVSLSYGEKIRRHEGMHYVSLEASGHAVLSERHTKEGFDRLSNHPAWPTIRETLVSHKYTDSTPVLVEEAWAYLSTGDTLGLTDEEADSWMEEWLRSFQQKNGSLSISEFKELSDAAEESRQRIYSESKTVDGRTSSGVQSVSDKRTKGTQGAHEEGTEEEAPSSPRADSGLTKTDNPLFARSDDPWADLIELSDEFGRLANEPEPSEKKTKQSKLAAGVEAKAIEAKLTAGFKGLPEYETVKVADQARMASELLRNDPQRAKEIAMGQALPPENLLPESVFVAVENQALQKGDVETLRELATVSTLSTEATGMGQRIRMLAERNPYSPVTAMKEIQTAREARAKKKMGPKFKERVITEIKTEVRKSAPKARDWKSFLSEIRCK
jgi:hypothetical protein